MIFADTPRLFLLVRIVFFLAWLVCTLIALVGLRRHKVSDTARVLWAGLIVAAPVLGALAYWIVRPQADEAVG